jgi:hypothetical protein
LEKVVGVVYDEEELQEEDMMDFDKEMTLIQRMMKK